MKKLFSYGLGFAGLVVALSSCKKDEVQVVATQTAMPTLKTSVTDAGVLASATAGDTVVRYTWTPLSFSYSDGSKPSAKVTYTLEFASTGTNFKTYGSLAAGDNLVRKAVSAGDLNGALTAAGFTPNTMGKVDVRLRAHYADNQSDVLSNITTLTATTYSRDLFFYGGSFGALSATSPLVREVSGQPRQYDGYVYVTDATSKFKLSNTSTASGTIFGSGTGANTITASGGDLTLTGPAMYRFQIDLAKGTFTATRTDWGLVGSATTGDDTGWNKSIPMTYDTKLKAWTGKISLPGTAASGKNEFKFRANDAWAINFGDKGDGSLKYDGANIKSAGPGMYNVTLDLNNPDKYVYTISQ